VPLDLPVPFGLNRQGFLDGSRPLELALLVEVPDVEADVLLRRLEEFGHLGLAEPDGLVLQAHLDAQALVGGRVEQEFGAPGRAVGITRRRRLLLGHVVGRVPP